MPKYEHPDFDVAAAFRRLQNALVSWERNTGRSSLLIFREAKGNVVEHGAMPSDVVIRLDNGISVDPQCSDLDDQFLLQRFTDSSYGPGAKEKV
jgi:hypothetical protein